MVGMSRLTSMKCGKRGLRNPLQDERRHLRRSLTSRAWLVAAVLGGILTGSDSARGQTYTWTGATGTNFNLSLIHI